MQSFVLLAAAAAWSGNRGSGSPACLVNGWRGIGVGRSQSRDHVEIFFAQPQLPAYHPFLRSIDDVDEYERI